jgi:tetratricopeptide (TPR) repeat protein
MKFRILAAILAFSVAVPMFAHNDSNGIQITTKSHRAHELFEQGVVKVSLLHQQAGLEHFRQAVKVDPNFALAHIFIAFFSLDPGEQVAERQKAMATRKFAGPEEQLIIDWQANASEGHWVPAIQAMNSALAQYPNDKYLHWMAGWWLVLSQNQQQRAIGLFEQVTKLDPKFPDAWNELAYCYAKTGNFDKAFNAIQHYTELVPNEANPQDSYAELSRMAGRFDEALKHYRMSLKIDPTFHESQLGLGDTYALMGDEARARTEYALAIEQATPVQKVLWSLQSAATYVREGDFRGADLAYRTVADQAHEQDFANLEAEAYRSMALYQKEGDAATAVDLLKKAEAALEGAHKVSQQLLGEERAQVWRTGVDRAVRDGNQARAQALLQKLSELSAANADDLIEVAYAGAAGAVYLAQGKYQEAASDFQGDPGNAVSMRGLVEAYEKSGKHDDAAKAASNLASLNVPLVEQAVVVPEFRKHRSSDSGVSFRSSSRL